MAFRQTDCWGNSAWRQLSCNALNILLRSGFIQSVQIQLTLCKLDLEPLEILWVSFQRQWVSNRAMYLQISARLSPDPSMVSARWEAPRYFEGMVPFVHLQIAMQGSIPFIAQRAMDITMLITCELHHLCAGCYSLQTKSITHYAKLEIQRQNIEESSESSVIPNSAAWTPDGAAWTADGTFLACHPTHNIITGHDFRDHSSSCSPSSKLH